MKIVIRSLLLTSMVAYTIAASAQAPTSEQTNCSNNNKTVASLTITTYNEERDKTVINELLKNIPYQSPLTANQELLAPYFNNSTVITDENRQTPQGNSVHILCTTEYMAKIIQLQVDGQESKTSGLICYSFCTVKEPMPNTMGMIAFCIAENSDLEKELFATALNELKEKKTAMILVYTHSNNELQNELLKQLGLQCLAQNPTNPQTGEQSNINMYTLIDENSVFAKSSAEQMDPASPVKHVTAETIEAEITKNDAPVILDLYATWCPPCKQLAPIIEELAAENAEKYVFVKYNVDTPCDYVSNLCKEHNIRGIPTLFFISKGQVKGVYTGYLSKEALQEKIAQAFN